MTAAKFYLCNSNEALLVISRESKTFPHDTSSGDRALIIAVNDVLQIKLISVIVIRLQLIELFIMRNELLLKNIENKSRECTHQCLVIERRACL